MQHKKGFGASFNWMFTLVAGAVILSLFIFLAIDYKILSERKFHTELAVEFEQQLEALSTIQSTAEINPDNIDVLEARFDCRSFTLFDSNPISYSGKYVFAPTEVRDDLFTLWFQEFAFPYKVANLIYIIPSNIKYYVVYDENSREFANSLINFVPKKFGSEEKIFKIELINSIDEIKINQDIKKDNLREIKFLSFNELNIPDFPAIVSSILIETKENGVVKINNKESYYFNKPLIFASLISDNYDCVLRERLLSRLKSLNSIHKEKTFKLWTKTQIQQPQCNYQLIMQTYPIEYDNLPELLEKQNLLGKQNEELFKKGCLDVF